jgi:putative nucleotidyltransferase with HDIG domain
LKPDRSEQARTRAILLALLAISVVVSAAIVHGSGPPFTYRIGQRPDRDLRVNVPEFKIRNQTKTANERQAAADLVPPVFINDPASLRELAARVDDLCTTIAKTKRFEDLRPDLQAVWRLTPESFLDLKAATDTTERQDTLHVQIAAAFGVLMRDGVLGPGTLPPNEEPSRLLSIREAIQSPFEPHLVPRERVQPERLIKPDSPVHQEFCSVFTAPRAGQVLLGLFAPFLEKSPTLSYDALGTSRMRQEARNRVPDHYDTYTRGEVLVEQDQTIGEEQLILLRLEHEAATAELGVGERVRRALGILALVAALFGLTASYVRRRERRFASEPHRVAMICGLMILTLAVVRLLASQTWNADLAPVAVAAMIVAVAYNPSFGMMITFALSLLSSIALGKDLAHFLVVMGGTSAAVLSLSEVRTRTKLIKVGMTAALAYFFMTWATGFWQDSPWDLMRNDSLWRAGWGLLAGFFLSGGLPFVENALGIVTGISLLELGDNTHPLLQELVRRAPGTHNHSITVGAIAEAAAERIGANALLVRIGAYFHDIGKMLKPHYFVENQVGPVNRHANLAPAMSTLIIVGHVKDGVDLGRQHHLPEPIIDLIEQHHGTTLVEFFYHEANRRNGGDPAAVPVPESAFRYPGPKPQTKEAAILMVADAIESASRALSDPAPARLEGLVSELIDKRLHDGQLDECGLTLREIAEIRDTLIKSLIGIYHGRVKYPQHRTA